MWTEVRCLRCAGRESPPPEGKGAMFSVEQLPVGSLPSPSSSLRSINYKGAEVASPLND